MMMRKLVALLSLAIALAVPSSALAAASVGPVAFTDEGTVLEAEGVLVGTDPTLAYLVNLNTAGVASTVCHLPNGRTRPGNDVWVSQAGQSPHLHAGETAFAVETSYELPVFSVEQAGCPPQTKSVEITDVRFVRATLMVFEGPSLTLVAVQGYELP